MQLVSSGADVRVKRGAGVMHHKVIIIDGGIVITGSYNFTRSASLRNDENLIIISDPETATRYAAEFAKIFNQSRTPASRGR
ncbi:MAG: Phospholipase D precursor [bacterium ADurb.Bin429]|nr:MAG: Phospholipase D precursor [bacterium ADurb.Bin429]